MRILVSSMEAGRSRTWLVEAPADATGAELRRRLSLPPGPDACIDPVRHGYAVGPPPPSADSASTLARVVVEAGPDAGACLWLPAGRWQVIGRDPLCDLTVEDPGLSRRHLRVRHGRDGFDVEDLGSTNGLETDDAVCGSAGSSGVRVRAGATVLRLEIAAAPPVTGTELDGRLHLHPWPRTVPEPGTVALTTPPEPALRTVRTPSAWSWTLPLAAAAAAALLLHMPLLLVFGLLGPAMVLGQHLGDRRSARVQQREAITSWRAECSHLDAELRVATGLERELRWTRDPGIAAAVRALLPAPTTTLWDRGAEALTVVVGVGSDTSGVTRDGVPTMVAEVPVTITLDEPVVVIGRPELRDAAVRSWVLQLAASHPPSALAIAVDATTPPVGWDLLGWLPHTVPHGREDAMRTLAWGTDLVLVQDARDAPPGMTRVLLDDSSTATIQRPGLPPRRARPTLLGRPLARSLARRLAGLQEVSRATTLDRRTATPLLGDLVPWPTDPDEAVQTWGGSGVRLDVPVGLDDAGRPVVLDLARDGPHALVAGTTGSGKSELLRTLVCGLVLLNRPSRMTLLLIDYKGGSSLGECARLPHSTGLVTDLDPHLAERVLVSLRAELTRREQVLARAGVRDVQDYPGVDLPRLVVVIDEFRVLAEELPDFLSGMVRIAAVGRSLGLHVVLATQRPAGIVTPDLRANVNLRIALRVRDASDSLDVLETPEAALLPEGRPGLALVRTGASPSRAFRVVQAGPPADPGPGSGQWSVREVRDVWEGWRCLHDDALTAAAPSGLGDLPEILGRAASALDDRASRVWLPPLPDTVGPQDVPGEAATSGRAWALADRPDLQRREPLLWRGANHLAVVGAATTGRSTTLASLARSASPAWIYVLDPGGGLDGVIAQDDSAVRAWVGPDDRAHGLRVLEVLNAVVEARRADAHARAAPIVVLLDGWDRWVEAYAELDSGRGVDLVLRLLRDGPAARIAVAVTGDRSLMVGRVAGHFPELWALRLHDPADLALAGLPMRARPRQQPPGRLVRVQDGVVAQVVRPVGGGRSTVTGRPDGAPDGASDGRPAGPPTGAPDGLPPPRVVTLPRVISGETAWAVGGDDAHEVPRPPGSVLVLGPPRSGVTTTLRHLGGPGAGDHEDHPAATVLVGAGTSEAGELASRLDDGVRTVVVDDAHLLAGTPVEDVVLEWATRTGGRLLVGGDVEACANLYRGLVPHVARGRTGVVLQPSSAQHGALLGVRLNLGDLKVPGRGLLVERGHCTRIQVAGP